MKLTSPRPTLLLFSTQWREREMSFLSSMTVMIEMQVDFKSPFLYHLG